MRESTILQLLAYYALSDKTRPYIGVVLPMTKQILVEYIAKWDYTPFLQLLFSTAKESVELMLVPTHTVGSHIEKNAKGLLYSLRLSYDESLRLPTNPWSRDFEVPSQIFLSSPQGHIRSGGPPSNIPDSEIVAVEDYIKTRGIHLYIHAPYYINLSKPENEQSKKNEEKESWSLKVLQHDLEIGNLIGARGVVVHCGKHLKLSREEGENVMYESVKKMLKYATEDCPLLLETSVGAGTELLHDLKDLIRFYDRFTIEERRIFQLVTDLCHVFAAGFSPMSFMESLISKFGPECIRLIHFNDSRDPCGSHVDRHARMGSGHLGFLPMLKCLRLALKYGIDCVTE